MKSVWLLAVVAMSAGAALAQGLVYDTSMLVVIPPANQAVAGVATQPGIACPEVPVVLPGPCAAILTRGVTNRPTVLVLGSEEYYALSSLRARNMGWRESPSNYNSYFSEGNPLTHFQPNPIVTRHGNPYYPYYQLSDSVQVNVARVLGKEERMVTLPRSLSRNQRQVLTNVYRQYRTLTPAQAVAMGYTTSNTCYPGVGVPYVNATMADNQFNALQPEAFSFSPEGRVVAVHYIMSTQDNRTFCLFGQQSQPSTLVPGRQQVTVWLFESNRAGIFNPTNASIQCATSTAGVTTIPATVCPPATGTTTPPVVTPTPQTTPPVTTPPATTPPTTTPSPGVGY